MNSQSTDMKQQTNDDLVRQYVDEYLRKARNSSEDTIKSHKHSLRNFFAFVKAGKQEYKEKDLHEFDFVETLDPSTDEPLKTADEVVEMSRRELEEFLKENPYGAINAEKCIEKEKQNKDRVTVLKYLNRKKNARPKIEYVKVDRNDVESVDKQDLFDFVVFLRDEKKNRSGGEGVKEGTYVKYKSALTTFYNKWIAQEDYLDWNGDKINFNEGKLDESSRNWGNEDGRSGDRKLKIEELEQLLEEANSVERMIILTFVKTGMRTKELADLKLNRVNLKKKFFYLNKRKSTKKSKKYKKENVIFDDELKHELESHIQTNILDADEDHSDLHKYENKHLFGHRNGGYSRGSILKLMKKVAKDAGLEKDFGGCHDFRHTFAWIYEHRVKGTEIGKTGYKKLQMSHKLTQSEKYTITRGGTGMDEDIPEERRKDYNRAIPKLLN